MKNLILKGISKRYIVLILGLLILGGLGYLGRQNFLLNEKNLTLENKVLDLEMKLRDVSSNLSLTNTALEQTEEQKADLSKSLIEEKERVGSLADQVQDITGTVGTLKKLSETDKELLQKYSKVYFLNENYIPPRLTDIDPKYIFGKADDSQIHKEVWPFLDDLLLEAEEDDVSFLISSAYRSFGAQTVLKESYRITYGSGTANRFSAEQGYSEHQLGTTVDFTTEALGGLSTSFENTESYKWLQENAHKYGFVISYPKENKYYQYEPWHWRFVGVSLARKLHSENKYFYDIDQREINEYLVSIFD